MERSVSETIYHRFFAAIEEQSTLGPEVANRLRTLWQQDRVQPEALVDEIFVPIAGAEATE